MWSGQVRSHVRLKDRGICSDLSIHCDDSEAATFSGSVREHMGWEQVESGALS